ncbi:MAG: response regulator [candidate division NC10 bacterium]|nr:response regulator [candidate division NC10 bacterium]
MLLVEDDRDMRWLLRNVLVQEGCSVITRATGKGALAALHRVRLDLILLPMTLPDMSGLRVVRRARRIHPRVPIIVISATSNQGIVQECLRLGVLAYLPKPFDLMELLGRIREALGRGERTL